MAGMVLADIRDGVGKGFPAFCAKCFIKSGIGLVSDAVGSCGIDDCLVECHQSLVGVTSGFFHEPLRHLFDVGIESHTEE